MASDAADHREDPRNLKPAAENPWYVLATIYGEQTEDLRDEELHRRNRRIWNGWSCGHLSDDERAELARSLGLDIGEFAPWTVQERAEVERIFAAKAIVLPDPEVEIRFDCTRFGESLNLSGFLFSKPVYFNDSEFTKSVNLCARFNDAVYFQYTTFIGSTTLSPDNFLGAVTFQSSNFAKHIEFDQEKFGNTVNFSSATFSEGATFYVVSFTDGVDFTSATFKGTVVFLYVSFQGHASFSGCRLDLSASFYDCFFHESANFTKAIFKANASFSPSAFLGGAQFKGAKFEKDVDFSSDDDDEWSKLTGFRGSANFEDVLFDGNARFAGAKFSDDVSFRRARFSGRAEFDAANFGARSIFQGASFGLFASFQRATCNGEASFSECHFESPTSFHRTSFLTHFPDFSGATLHQNTTFSDKDEFWPKMPGALSDAAEDSRKSLAIIRNTVGKQGLPEEEHYFFRREMAFAARIGTLPQRLPYRLFGFFSDFGHSIAKPTRWLVVLWAIGSGCYWKWWLSGLEEPISATPAGFTAMGFSLAQLFSFLGFNRVFFDGDAQQMAWGLQAVAGFQAIAGVVLLFLLGLALRNRFRLK